MFAPSVTSSLISIGLSRFGTLGLENFEPALPPETFEFYEFSPLSDYSLYLGDFLVAYEALGDVFAMLDIGFGGDLELPIEF